jgi:hypothetical protein
MRMHPGQYGILKEMFIQPFVEAIGEGFPDNPKYLQSAIWYAFIGQPDSILRGPFHGSQAVYAAMVTFQRLFAGEISLASTFGNEAPSLAILRLGILDAIIDCMHEQYPVIAAQIYPTVNIIDGNIQGMQRIRELFKQYISVTHSGSLERYKLAYEIVLIKEQLGLPSYFDSTVNIFTLPGYSPGDFNYLDLSGLDLSRRAQGDGNFKGLTIKYSNCAKTTWDGVSLYGADFSGSSLRGADFSNLAVRDSIVLTGADIEGTYFEVNHVPDRRAINFNRISLSQSQLTLFCHRDTSATSVSNVTKLHDTAVIDQRHNSEAMQNEYDKRFGLISMSSL